MNPLGNYLPVDRRRALAEQRLLPEQARGAALFADISGFTPLTEALTKTLGARRGVEELTLHLNRVWDVLIGQIHRFNGSVIAFAGDAITCWFEGDNGLRAIAAGLGMQEAIRQVKRIPIPQGGEVELAMKAAVSTGSARRVVVGNPDIQLMDVFAGRTLNRMGLGGHLAARGEVVADEETVSALSDALVLDGWHEDPGHPGRAAIIQALRQPLNPPTEVSTPDLETSVVRSWIIPEVFRRLGQGEGEFLTELRPAIALFLKFEGLDFDGDPEAGRKMDAFVSWVQRALHELEGFLIDVSTGDKGCYLYANFGAPLAHEDDGWRALTVAHRLRSLPSELSFITSVQIGLSRGTMRTGAYGSATRRTYGVLGDEVNMAARLMEKASPGQVLVSETLQDVLRTGFRWDSLPAYKPKGKSAKVNLFALLGPSESLAPRLKELDTSLPLVGRNRELHLLEEKLALARQGRGQTVGVTAEAGMGKSRLVAELLRLVADQPVEVLEGHCLSHGTNTSYLTWWPVWRRLFNVQEQWDPATLLQHLSEALAAIDASFPLRAPLLASALNLPIPDNEVTAGFDAQLRKSSLEALLVACLNHRARQGPLLVFLDDCHWIDPLSRDLAEAIGRSIAELPVVLLVTYRPRHETEDASRFLSQLPGFHEITLQDLEPQESRHFLQLKTAQLFGTEVHLPENAVASLTQRAQGNPFYLEELLNFIRDHNITPESLTSVDSLELPTTLHTLILSRIDRLHERAKTTLKVASVIGRVFPADVLVSVHPQSDPNRIHSELEDLRRLDLTPLEQPKPTLTYIFKHVVTQEVSYESIPFATRSHLHNDIGLHLEQRHANALDQHLNLLAFHFDRSPNTGKRRHYLLLAGDAAQARYANESAIHHYSRVLPLLKGSQRVTVQLKLGAVLELVGQWTEAREVYDQALAQTSSFDDHAATARCQVAVGDLLRKQGAYDEASARLAEAKRLFQQAHDQAGVAEALQIGGTIAAQQGRYDPAVDLYYESLQSWRLLNNSARMASLLSNLGILAWYQGELLQAQHLYEGSLAIRRKLGDRRAIANSLNNLGLVLRDMEHHRQARQLIQESVTISRELGDRWAVANALTSLADVALTQEDNQATRQFLLESLAINRELGDRTALAFILEIGAMLAAAQNHAQGALQLAAAAEFLRHEIGSALSPAEQALLDRKLEPARAQLSPEAQQACKESAQSTPPQSQLEEVLKALA